MQEKKFFNEITNVIESIEVNHQVREIQDNYETLKGYWEIGKLLIEAQGGEARAKYGNRLINKWSIIFVNRYGKKYSARLLRKMRQFYTNYNIWPTLSAKLSWSHIIEILSLKNTNERNYYINQVILNHLSVRELRNEIKTKAYDRLSYADKENIKLIEGNNCRLSITDMIKDPIILNINDNNSINEKVLHKLLISELENRFLELGVGFALIGHEYKIIIDNHTYRIDLLFFNYKLNSFIVVEVKTKTMKVKDIDQVKFYVRLIDQYIKEKNNNKTCGLLLAKEKDKYVIKYSTDNDILVTTYKLNN